MASSRPAFPVRALARAAQLTWPDAVACRRTAAVLHGFPVVPGQIAEVVTQRRHRAVLRVRPYCQGDLRPDDVTELGGLRVTARERTALDCLAFLPFEEALDLYLWLWAGHELPRRRIVEAVHGQVGRPGGVQLRRLLVVTRQGPVSSSGYRLHRLLKAAGVTGWAPGAPAGGLADPAAASEVTFPSARVVVAVCGPRSGTLQVLPMPQPRRRNRYDSMAWMGFMILRVTPADLRYAPDAVLARVRRVLSSRQGLAARAVLVPRPEGFNLGSFRATPQERVRAPVTPASVATSAARTS